MICNIAARGKRAAADTIRSKAEGYIRRRVGVVLEFGPWASTLPMSMLLGEIVAIQQCRCIYRTLYRMARLGDIPDTREPKRNTRACPLSVTASHRTVRPNVQYNIYLDIENTHGTIRSNVTKRYPQQRSPRLGRYIHTHIRTYIHARMHAYIHKRVHTFIHACMLKSTTTVEYCSTINSRPRVCKFAAHQTKHRQVCTREGEDKNAEERRKRPVETFPPIRALKLEKRSLSGCSPSDGFRTVPTREGTNVRNIGARPGQREVISQTRTGLTRVAAERTTVVRTTMRRRGR